ncbi:hypothetical protein [Siminovitchia fordii]|uniref:Uncharacterized protein n=1 Tax=Siminovitchia fordii TaxID=254759 RepID=A0ABQ4K2H6_9BACI|nr:hypothetical protein [Siminovitchia fordii]GIN19841.1 hypothetical protein J1TS3_09750 [Siminovitchia fordii]
MNLQANALEHGEFIPNKQPIQKVGIIGEVFPSKKDLSNNLTPKRYYTY